MSWSFFGGSQPSKRNKSRRQGERRRLNGFGARLNRFEHLEQRNLLAVLTVNTNGDNITSDSLLTLREALAVVSNGSATGTIPVLGRALTAGEAAQINSSSAFGTNDTIGFSGVVSPIVLGSELPIDKALTVSGPGLSSLTIDGNNTSRIFNIDTTAGAVTIKGLTLTKGFAGGGNYGGAIYSTSLSTLTITDSKITASKADSGGGVYATGSVVLANVRIGDAGADKNEATAGTGGGIRSLGNVTLKNSVVSGNVADNSGGGIRGLAVSLQDTKVQDNTSGLNGGGIRATTVSLQNSTISGNKAEECGGGIYASSGVVVQSSTISGNIAGASPGLVGGNGGGIYSNASVVLRNSTVARNRTYAGTSYDGDGGGINAVTVTLQNSTVADNTADTTAAHGGGVFATTKLTIQNSIVVGNHDIGDATLLPDINNPATTSVRFSLIGDIGAIPAGGAGTQFEVLGSTQQSSSFSNFIGRTGMTTIAMNTVLDTDGLGNAKLQNNNGALPATTETVALIGVAINKGSNALAISTTQGDQRGLPFARISPLAGTVDMGAFEVQSPPIPAIPTAITIANQTANVGVSFGFNASPPFAAALSGSLVYSVVRENSGLISPPGALPDWLSFNSTTGVFTGTPTSLDVGAITLRVTATNQVGGVGSGTFTLTVVAAPEISVQVNGVEIASGGTAASAGSTSTSIDIPVNIQNIDTGALTLTGAAPFISISGANPGDFTVTTPPASSIPTGGNTVAIVKFAPTANGLRTALLTIANNDSDENPYTITVQGTGTGIAATVPEINVQVNGVDVNSGGTRDVGTTSATINVPVNIQNTGSNTLTLSGSPLIAVSGANAADFQVTTPPASSIPALNNSIATVRFSPSANGLRTATLTIANNDSDENPYTINLQGTGSGITSGLPFTEDFNSGTASPLIVPQTGTWTVVSQEYKATRTPGTNAISTFNLGPLPPAGVTVQTTVRVGPTGTSPIGRTFSNGFIVFDYQDNSNFKLAGIEAANDLLVISQVVGGVYSRLAFRAVRFDPGVNYTLRAVITNNAVTVTANGTISLAAAAANLLDGQVGVGTINADTVFDNISVTA